MRTCRRRRRVAGVAVGVVAELVEERGGKGHSVGGEIGLGGGVRLDGGKVLYYGNGISS